MAPHRARFVTRSVLLFASVVSCLVTLPHLASAADRKTEARTHFDQGVLLFRDGDFQAAAIEFRRAYDAEPNYRVLYNIGQACNEAKDYACALTSFAAYLDQGGAEVQSTRRAQLEQQIEKLRLRTGRLSVKSNVDGAAVLVDDVAVGRTPLPSAVLVSAGRRKVAVVSPAGVQQIRAVEVAGGDETSVELAFQVADYHTDGRPGPTDVSRDAPLEPEGELATHADTGRTARIVLPAVVTGVLVAAAVFSGVEALRSKNDFDDAIANRPGDRDAIENDRRRTRSWALSADLLTGAAIIGGVFTLIAVFHGGAENTAPPPSTGTSVSLGPGSFLLTTRF